MFTLMLEFEYDAEVNPSRWESHKHLVPKNSWKNIRVLFLTYESLLFLLLHENYLHNKSVTRSCHAIILLCIFWLTYFTKFPGIQPSYVAFWQHSKISIKFWSKFLWKFNLLKSPSKSNSNRARLVFLSFRVRKCFRKPVPVFRTDFQKLPNIVSMPWKKYKIV